MGPITNASPVEAAPSKSRAALERGSVHQFRNCSGSGSGARVETFARLPSKIDRDIFTFSVSVLMTSVHRGVGFQAGLTLNHFDASEG